MLFFIKASNCMSQKQCSAITIAILGSHFRMEPEKMIACPTASHIGDRKGHCHVI